MHSLRAAFNVAGFSTPPLSMRELSQKLGFSLPTTMREVLGLPPLFAENEIELFKSYDLKEKNVDVKAIIEKIDDIPDFFIPFQDGLTGRPFPENEEARKVQENRQKLNGMLKAMANQVDALGADTKQIRNFILTRQGDTAEDRINLDNLPKANFDVLEPGDPIWGNALRTDNVEFFSQDGAGPDSQLPGYEGPQLSSDMIQKIVDVALFLHPGSLEREFWKGLLKAESIVGQREYPRAKEAYQALIDDQRVTELQRKFVALRQAAAQNALADGLFNSLPPGDKTRREEVRDAYEETQNILDKNGVSRGNPVAEDLLVHKNNQLLMVDAGFNTLGTSSVVTPVNNKTAKDFLDEATDSLVQARQSLAAYRRFSERLEGEIEDTIQIDLDTTKAHDEIKLLELENKVLQIQRNKLDLKDGFLDPQIAFQPNFTLTNIIESLPEKAANMGVGGTVSVGADAVFRVAELVQQKLHLGFEKKISDLNIKMIDTRIGQANRQLVSVNNLGASNNIQVQKYLELSNRFEDLTLESVRTAMRKAFRAEVQLAYERGTAFQPKHIKPDILNVKSIDHVNDLVEKFNTEQLSKLRTEINQNLQATGLEIPIFLSKLDLRALARFQQKGITEFYISLYDTDREVLGAPNVRIRNVQIELQDLGMPPEGITVFLTHRGTFFVRDEESFFESTELVPNETTLEEAELAFSDGRNLTAKGVTLINAAENTRPFRAGIPPTSEPSSDRQGLEGYGVTGLWRLNISDTHLNEVNLATLTDVKLTFFTAVGHPPPEKQDHVSGLIEKYELKQEEEQGDVLDKITFFSMRDKFRFKMNELIDSHTVDIDISEETGVLEGRDGDTLLKAIVLQLVNPDGGIEGLEVELRREDLDRVFNFKTIKEGFTADLEKDLETIDPRFPVGGLWTVNVPDTTELDDPNRQSDIRWFLIHEKRPRVNP